ncbi:LuxR C-terminal-related transcriptional regulator [Variovorax sp. RA8]|uniref:LuxR C-terminal-related transcriptional regulator n=1 Tax=Variovorax sp. (strain JCM 16519 / RA8) TaxID=662548 RepID=UPI0013199F2B|nr:hypothetical protein RA8CHR_02175 [Variovorax sp. RA8]
MPGAAQVFPAASNPGADVPRLTMRQTQCLQLVSEGKSSKQIAQMGWLHDR